MSNECEFSKWWESQIQNHGLLENIAESTTDIDHQSTINSMSNFTMLAHHIFKIDSTFTFTKEIVDEIIKEMAAGVQPNNVTAIKDWLLRKKD